MTDTLKLMSTIKDPKTFVDSELDYDTRKLIAYWNKCLDIIKDNVNKQVFKTWFSPLKPVKWENNGLLLQVPSQFFMEWIEEHYYDLMQKTVRKIFGEDIKLQYEIYVDTGNETGFVRMPAFRNAPNGSQSALSFSKQDAERQKQSEFNPRYTFDNFITGESNQLAASAAKAVASKPGGTNFNPLVIYSDTGLGKTHLVQAIGNSLHKTHPKANILYTNSEVFTYDFISSLQYQKGSEFVNKYRNVDVLIIDDIQFFEGKEKTQDNFFHTFNALHQAGKQIILTSDRPIKDLKGLDERLISRFQWGLTVDIQKPDIETRMAILRMKAENEGINLPYEIVEYIAKHITNSVRQLEGSLINLLAKHTLDARPLSIDLAKEVVSGYSTMDNKQIDIDFIKRIVSEYYKVDLETMESKTRKHEVALARQMSMYLAKKLTNMSLKSIGASFGGRDHSTVLHSCTTIDNYLATDKTVKADLGKIKLMMTE